MALILHGTNGITDVNGTAAAPAITGTDTDTGVFFGTNTVSLSTNGTERLQIDPSGNAGLGVTPSAFSGGKAIEIGAAGNAFNGYEASNILVSSGAYYNGGWKYANSSYGASLYQQYRGTHNWQIAASGTAGNAITFTQAMTLDASGNLGIGETSPSSYYSGFRNLVVGNTSTNFTGITVASTTVGQGTLAFADGTSGNTAYRGYVQYDHTSDFLAFASAGSERARIDSSGYFNAGNGYKPSGYHALSANNGGTFFVTGGSSYTSLAPNNFSTAIANADATGANVSSASVLYVQKNAGQGRSINAAGTINASGADYAEYMIKAGDFTIAKGDVCGIDANGKLTNMFADAVSFVVKSTNPSYVGNDSWGADLGDDEAVIESVRQTLDRIAFCGQVPVNVTGATPGQFIIPVNDNGAIKGEAVSNPTFEQYQIAVGKVIAIEQDGRAKIIVKVA